MKANKLISVILCIAMVLSTMSFTAFADGTEEPASVDFTISTVDELIAFSKDVNNGNDFSGKTVQLTADITFDEDDYWYDNRSETVTNNVINNFAGTFDGNDKTIRGLKFNFYTSTTATGDFSGPAMGLFGTVTGKVKDLTLDTVTADIKIDGTARLRAGFGILACSLAGAAENCKVNNVEVNTNGRIRESGGMFIGVSGTATNCTATNVKINSTSANGYTFEDMGGFAGVVTGSLNNCHIDTVAITAENPEYGSFKKVGGMIGRTNNESVVTGCTAKNVTLGATTLLCYTGGFVGHAENKTASYTNCSAENVTIKTGNGRSTQTGGFVGEAYGVTFDNCDVDKVTINVGVADSGKVVGSTAGFCGQTNSSGATFKNCDVTELDMTVAGDIENGIGGFLTSAGGAGGTFESCSVAGNIDATDTNTDDAVGGFLGNLGWGGEAKVEIKNSSADVDIDAAGPAGGFVGKADSSNASASLTVSSSIATGDVTSTAPDAFVGTGTTGDYTNCKNNGEMIGNAIIGEKEYYDLADAFEYAKANDGSVIKLLNDVDLSDWTAVNMDATAFTLDGNNKTITGLKTALIDSVTTGGKEVVIKDLTIKGANNAGLHSDHSGAVNAGGLINVIGYVKLTLENINIVDSVIGGDSTAYAGGLIGYVGATAESVYEINSCSVKNTTITCTSSAGGLFGHSNGGLTTISETTVGANKIKGEKAAKEGSLIGTLTSCAGTKIDVTETTESTGTGTLNVIGRVYTGVTYTGGSYFTDPEMASDTNDSTEITIADGFGVEVSDEKYIVKDITARSLTVVADKDVAYVDDTVEVEIKIDGTNITFADYTFKYDGNIFTCADDTDNDGEIEYNTYKQTEGDVFASGEVLATYTLKVKAQATDNVTTALSLSSDSKAGNDNDSINGVSAETTLVDDSVTIKFRTLDAVVVKVDGNTETATSKDIPYDMCNHTFEATTATEGAKVEYAVTFEGNSSSIDAIKEIGTYEITYTITKDGYTPIIGSFTIEIIEPLYEIEIVKDYVKGKVAVLVYTNVTDVCYNYDGNLMIDVSAKNYTYNETHYTSVFGYVTNPLTDENGDNTLDKAVYAEKLGLVKPTSELLEVIAVDNDLNEDDNVDQYDINAAYGVYNVRSAYFTNANAMKIVLKADVSCDKIVDNTDNVAVYNAFYNPTTTD